MSKELSIKEKAKAYDEAIKLIKKCATDKYGCVIGIKPSDIFSELKESEDERIKGAIIDHLKDNNLIEWAAWLEKQVVQKEIDYNEELKKCKDNPLYFFDKYVKVKFKEHKHNWSEDDEKMMQYVIGSIDINISDSNFKNIRIWFESLKDRVQLQPKQEWSEEDEYNRNIILYCLNNESVGQTDYENAINWLKSLNPQNNVTDKELIQAKKEAYNDALNKIEYHSGEPTYADGWHDAIDCIQKNAIIHQNTITDEELVQAKKEAYNEALNKIEYHSGEPTFDDGWSAAIWYLKKRNGRPQTTWLPSKEQLHYLNWIANIKLGDSVVEQEVSKHLNELYENLKKLRKE